MSMTLCWSRYANLVLLHFGEWKVVWHGLPAKEGHMFGYCFFIDLPFNPWRYQANKILVPI